MKESSTKRAVQTDEAPAAVGSYSQGVISQGFLFTAGQVALTREGKLNNATVEDEVGQVMDNLTAVLAAGGCALSDVVRTQVYIRRQEDFGRVNEAYARRLQEADVDVLPARDCVVLAPPLDGANVEMSMIAEIPTAYGLEYLHG